MPLNGVRRVRDIAMWNNMINDIYRNRLGNESEESTDPLNKFQMPYYIPGLLIFPISAIEADSLDNGIFSCIYRSVLSAIRWIDISFWAAFLYVFGSCLGVASAYCSILSHNTDDGKQVVELLWVN